MKKILFLTLLLLCSQALAAYKLKATFDIGLNKEIKLNVQNLPQTLEHNGSLALNKADIHLGFWLAGKQYEQVYALDLKTKQLTIPAKPLVPWIKSKLPKDWTGIDYINKAQIDAVYTIADKSQPSGLRSEHLLVERIWIEDWPKLNTLSVPFFKQIDPSGFTLTVEEVTENVSQ